MTVDNLIPAHDTTRNVEQAADHVADIINAGAVSVMISIGHRTGLFDVLARLPAATSEQIADTAELAERYVREWLAVMVTAGIVDFDPKHRAYRLPQAYAANLSRCGSAGNLAVYAQTIPLMGSIQDRLLTCFETGQGTRYDDYPCFHQFMAEDSMQTVVTPLFDHILPLGGDITHRLETGIDVLDAGCGRGEALMALAERYPASRFKGYDLCADAIAYAKALAGQKELANAVFATMDMTDFNEAGEYDFITSFDAVHDQKDPERLIKSLHRALRPNGIYLMQDIGGSAKLENNLSFPMAPLLYAVSCSHCMPVSLGQGGKGLGTMWGWETAEKMLRRAGFCSIERHVLEHDPMNVWFVSRTSPQTA